MFKTRLLVGVPLAAVFLLALFWRGWPGAVLFTLLLPLFSVIAIGEYLKLAEGLGVGGFPRLAMAFGGLYPLAVGVLPVVPTIWGLPPWPAEPFEAGTLASFLVLGFREVFRREDRANAMLRLLVSLAGLVYLCWTLGFIPRLYFAGGFTGGDGRWLVLFLVVVTKIGDVGAYAAGMLTSRRARGNHKMAPLISPKKSWEGLAGGLVVSVAAALALVLVWPERFALNGIVVLSPATAVFWGFFCTVLGFWGDVAESALKRAANVKNSGMVPGLGGVLDVLDSLTLVAPFFYAYVCLVASR
ncbi:MAG: phosphatidate cytidylyltransferase [Lentisphaeria bacterium]